MPNINEFIGPRPTEKVISSLEKIIGNKPCAKCDLDVNEYFWDKTKYVMTWKCDNGHENTVSVNQ